MAALESDLRRQLENVIIQARDVAEGAARSALQKRAVDAAEPFSHFGPNEKELRTRLRARGRQAGDVRNADKTQSIDQLTQDLAYEFWHRMLFARFLAENNLLMHPDGVPVSLEECEELAKDADPPAPNGFVLAARYASTMLPQIFRIDDVLLETDFAPEQRLALERLLASLPQKTFLADDSLGWVYQFWQSKKKDEVNQSGDKIDGRTLPAVTQLFTEHYMVQFLLHNTIGAWWCGRQNLKGSPGGAGVPAGRSPVEMEYLRWREDGTPSGGKFEGWPKSLADFTMLDPCCGSGHFLVAAFNLLVPIRMYDENLTADKACEVVLRDNIFGLELDPRCTQIAAFALALAAWKYPDAGGYRSLPLLNIACSGQGVTGKKEEWLALANGDEKLRNGMDRLYDLFQQAPQLGSLIDPRRERGNMYEAGYAELHPLLVKALAKKPVDAELAAVGVAAQGITRAAEILGGRHTLVVTNVPYLGRGKQNDVMKDYLEEHYSEGKADLATGFVMRCLDLCNKGGTSALVTPQNWLFLTTYKKIRETLLKHYVWNGVARLGSRAFETITGEVVNVALLILSHTSPSAASTMVGINAADAKTTTDKADWLSNRVATPIRLMKQSDQLRNPDARVTTEPLEQSVLLSQYADSYWGIGTGDIPRFVRQIWEVVDKHPWHHLQTTFTETLDYTGRDECILMLNEDEVSRLPQHDIELRQANRWTRGSEGWSKAGIAVQLMHNLAATLYCGEIFQNGVAVIIPKQKRYLAAIWCFCQSPNFVEEIRRIDQKLSVTNHTLLKVPFDLSYWQSVADDKFPHGLPKPQSDDPTQWLFNGDIATSADPLQVAVARLLGHRWPEQAKSADAIDKLADSDGIICLPSVRGKAAANERLLDVLQTAYGKKWSDSLLHNLLTRAGCSAGTTLDDWLRNEFVEQHCKRFNNRPFVWHIWDGRKDGFAALVDYHKLDHKGLENLTYAYLGEWITAQSKSDKAGAESRLGAAQELQRKLKLILEGVVVVQNPEETDLSKRRVDSAYDIFVRWKPLHEQAIGWNPDLNDGVRMNIRPFMEVGILRKNPNIKWTKDRGKEPERDKSDYPWFWSGNEFLGDRVNDIHLTIAEKEAARSQKQEGAS